MLRLWRDQVRIVLCPDRLITVHSRGGLRPHIVAKQVRMYSASDTGWHAALPVLRAVLENPDWQNADGTVIISNHFVRFLLLPWSEVSLTEAEKQSLLQHRFAEIYGEDSATWEMRLNEGSFGSPSLASAVDQGLLEQLKGIFKTSRLRLKSIQPYLMTAFNVCRRELGNETAWLILAEHGAFCIGLVNNGQWRSIRLRRTENDWLDEAMLLLERETLLVDKKNESSKVYIYAPGISVATPAERGLLMIRTLHPGLDAALAPAEMGLYAMAVAGM